MILRKHTLILTIFSLLAIFSYGQKIKYKDLFVLLNAKQYDQAEPFLKKYLNDNHDNPNAFLFMGYIYEGKVLSSDILKETELQSNYIDSSILFFDMAYKGIDDRELRKNDELYQTYSRRDLRTGKFGLSLSDVQLDLEKRMSSLKDRQKRLVLLKEKFKNTQRIYSNCEGLFKAISAPFKDQKEFYLRVNEDVMSDISKLARQYDSCVISFNDYKGILESFGKTGYNQQLDVQTINDFKRDGYKPVDFFEDEVKLWDYKRWALSSLDVITKEIIPIKASLVSMDKDLNNLREKVRKDSVSVRNELSEFDDKMKALAMRKYDDNPMPVDVFKLKVAELKYGSELARSRALRDSSDLVLKMTLYKSQIALLGDIDSLSSILMKRDFDYDVENYKDYVNNSYGSGSVLKSLIKSTGDFAKIEMVEKKNQVASIIDALDWIIDKTDSIPVSSDVKSKYYYPLSIVANEYTFGLKLKDTTSAYFYTISTSRKPEVKSVHKVDTAIYKIINLPLIKGISTSSIEQGVYFVVMYSENRLDNKIPSTVYKISRSQGLVWSNRFNWVGKPTEVLYNISDGNLSVKVSTDDGIKIVIIQPDGKQLSDKGN